MRERNEKYAFATLMVKLLGGIAGYDNKIQQSLLESYGEELYQLRYNSEYQTRRARDLIDVVRKAEAQSKLLDKLDRLTANAPALHGEETKT